MIQMKLNVLSHLEVLVEAQRQHAMIELEGGRRSPFCDRNAARSSILPLCRNDSGVADADKLETVQ